MADEPIVMRYLPEPISMEVMPGYCVVAGSSRPML